jgi:hypothetical protein
MRRVVGAAQLPAIRSQTLHAQANSSCSVTLVTDTVGFGTIALLQFGFCDEARLNDGLCTGTQV